VVTIAAIQMAAAEQLRHELKADRVTVAFSTRHGTVELVAERDGPVRILLGGEEISRGMAA
jgi:hypothetical protein